MKCQKLKVSHDQQLRDQNVVIRKLVFWWGYRNQLAGTLSWWKSSRCLRFSSSVNSRHIRPMVAPSWHTDRCGFLAFTWNQTCSSQHTSQSPRIHTYTCLTAPCPGVPGQAGTRKVKPIWILLKQETVSGSGISWAICTSAPRSRQITMPTPHHSVFTGQMPFPPPNQQRQSTVQAVRMLITMMYQADETFYWTMQSCPPCEYKSTLFKVFQVQVPVKINIRESRCISQGNKKSPTFYSKSIITSYHPH